MVDKEEKEITEEVPEWEIKAIMRKGRMNSYNYWKEKEQESTQKKYRD